MKKRIFVVGSSRFPRGSAGANYDQYLALALIEQGWNVIVLGCGDNSEEHNYSGKYLYRGIEYYNKPFLKEEDNSSFNLMNVLSLVTPLMGYTGTSCYSSYNSYDNSSSIFLGTLIGKSKGSKANRHYK